MSFKSLRSPLNNRGSNITTGTVSGKVEQFQMNEIAAFQGFGVTVDVSGSYAKTTSGDYDVYTFTGPGSWVFKSSGTVSNLYIDGTGGGGGGGGAPNPGAPFGPAGSGGGGGSGAMGIVYADGFQAATTWTITTGGAGTGGPAQNGAAAGQSGGSGGTTSVADPSNTLVSFGGGGGGSGGSFDPHPSPTRGGAGGSGGPITVHPSLSTTVALGGAAGEIGSNSTSPGGAGGSPKWPSFNPYAVIPVPAPIQNDTNQGGAGGPSPSPGTAGEPGHFLRIFYDRNNNNFTVNEL